METSKLEERTRRVEQAIKDAGHTWTSAAAALGMSHSAPTKWKKGQFSEDTLAQLADLTDHSQVYLYFGVGPARKDEAARFFSGYNPPSSQLKAGMAPLISWTQAGQWHAIADTFTVADAEDWLACPKHMGPRTFCLRVRGLMQEPKYHKGDIIFVDPDAPAADDKDVIVWVGSEEETTFWQLKVEGSQRFLTARNPNWPGARLIRVTESDRIIGVVVGIWVDV